MQTAHCASMRSKTGYAECGYFHCYLKMDAPRALVFRPLVKGNEALGTRLPLARSNSGSPQFTDFPSLCAYPESSLTNLIGSGLNILCLHSHSKPEYRWAWPGVPIFPAHDKRDPWGRGWPPLQSKITVLSKKNSMTYKNTINAPGILPLNCKRHITGYPSF